MIPKIKRQKYTIFFEYEQLDSKSSKSLQTLVKFVNFLLCLVDELDKLCCIFAPDFQNCKTNLINKIL